MWAVTSQTVVADMERGAFGTTAAAHAANDVVTINAVVSDAELFTALNDELSSLSGEGLFRVAASDLAYAANTAGYSLPADFLDVYELRWDAPGVSKNWPLISAREYAISRDLSTTDFGAGGNALMLYGSVTPGAVIRLRYKAGFNRLTGLADNVVATSGIHAEALPLLAVGAALRCAAGRPMRRSHLSAQGSPRRAEEVSVNDGLAAPGALRQLRRDLLGAEAARLAQRYPTRI